MVYQQFGCIPPSSPTPVLGQFSCFVVSLSHGYLIHLPVFVNQNLEKKNEIENNKKKQIGGEG
jgi:hypothetical protein